MASTDIHAICSGSSRPRSTSTCSTGAIFLEDGERPAYVNGIALGQDGTVYTLSRIEPNGKRRGDRIKFPGPLAK